MLEILSSHKESYNELFTDSASRCLITHMNFYPFIVALSRC